MFDYLKEEDLNDLSYIIKENFGYVPSIQGLNELLKNTDIIKLVYRNEDVLVGFAIIENRYNYIKDKKYFYLNYVTVKKEYQRNGIGTKLMKKVEELASYHKINYIEFTSSNKISQEFYEKNNYKKRDTIVFRKEI